MGFDGDAVCFVKEGDEFEGSEGVEDAVGDEEVFVDGLLGPSPGRNWATMKARTVFPLAPR